MTMLKVENVVSGYGKIVIVYGVSIEVHKGELVTMIGPNGAGKSTLLKTIARIVPAFSGRIIFENNDITNLSAEELIHQGINYVPQLDNVFPNMTVFENLEIGALYNQDEFDENLDVVYDIFPILQERSKQKARKLSGGERQMLALARALMSNPRMLLLDEPTAALAPVLVNEILETIKQLKEKRNISILLVEQNARKSLEISDRAYVLVMGKIVRTGTGQDLLNDPDLGKAFLGA